MKSIPKPWRFLAPMVANSDEAYRDLARMYGADLCYTEMVHCRGYNNGRKNPRVNQWYTTRPTDRPLVIQICGNNPEIMLETCLSVQEVCDAIDINFGCPQEIARKGHYGSWLMDDFQLVGEIVKTLSSRISVPLFCKIRVFETIEKTVEYAKMIEANGCSLLAVHGRQRIQKGPNSGLASWDHIRAVKQSLSIPVIANGNMIYYDDIKRCTDYTGCDGVMIAEPHLYVPTIFVPGVFKSTDIFKQYLQIIIETPQKAQFKHMKSHAFKMMKPLLSHRPDLLVSLGSCCNIHDFLAFIEQINRLVGQNEIPTEALYFKPYIRPLPEAKNVIDK